MNHPNQSLVNFPRSTVRAAQLGHHWQISNKLTQWAKRFDFLFKFFLVLNGALVGDQSEEQVIRNHQEPIDAELIVHTIEASRHNTRGAESQTDCP